SGGGESRRWFVPLTDQLEHSNSGCLRFKCSSVRESKPINRLPVHELSAVNDHCLRFKYKATARLSCGSNNRTDFCRLGHFEECSSFDIVKIAVDRNGGGHEGMRTNAPHIGHDTRMDISDRQPVDELASVRAWPRAAI